MAVEPAALSFVSVVLLGVFIPVKRVRTSVPSLAILLWLIGCNLVHGINALIWAGNLNVHVPVWCDIVTKLVLGANVALPGAFLCISRHLELISSKRKIETDLKTTRNRTLLDFLFCYIIPVIYMALRVWFPPLPGVPN
ncbi:hypothetical protein K443DRAFT_112025 [Laccaria amethystina LaAM-08-1]|uniref:Uncharacterized protein n=1 Tax=Laccaria amethystina LaAM-08-1 TaxID=1095629 RepID=A0A0C9X7B4_9AGAR|nr:hypothetical protein K443DRAFT_112025 [Laccaria amethystina LaAM-08-1]